MPSMKRTNRRSGRGRRRAGPFREARNPAPNSMQYKGPIVSAADKEEAETIVTILNFTGSIASDAGGTIDTLYSSDPSSYALGDWTNMAATWHEYRVLGFRMEYFPNNRYSKASTVCTPMIVCVDRQSAGTLGSYQVAMDHSSAKKVSLEDPWFKEARMQQLEEAAFISTLAPVALMWIKFFATGLSVSTTYGRSFVYLRLQFRGRK